MRKRVIITICLTALILAAEFVPLSFATDASSARQAINRAEQDLNSAYVNVSRADSAGADVSELLKKLNSAGTYLSEATLSFKAGNYDDAVSLALECIEALKGLENEAVALEVYAEGVHFNTIFSALFVSVFGILCVVILGFLGWSFLKKRHFRDILNKRPKVVDIREL